MTETHTAVRDAITEERASDAVEHHLDECPSCRSFANAVDHVRELAPTLVARPPADLADRIVAELDLGASSHPAFLPSVFDGTVRRVMALAAALLLVVGLAAVLRAPDDPTAVVLASAERTLAEGSAEVTVDAEVEVVIPVHDGAPDLSRVPAEMHAHVHAQWAAVMARFEQQLEEFQRQVDTTMRDAQQQIEDAQRRMQQQMEEAARRMQGSFGEPSDGAWEAPRAPAPPAPPVPPELPALPEAPDGPEAPGAPQPPTPPTSLATRVTVQADGDVMFGDRVHLDGRAGTDGDATGFELDVRGDAALYRGPDGTWTSLPGPAGPVGSVLLDADALGQVLSAAADVEFVGRADGLRHYRFQVDGGVVGGTSAAWDVEAWLDGDGRARRVELSTDQAMDDGGMRHTRVGMRLTAFGSSGPSSVPSPRGRAALPTEASLLLYPFGPNVAAAADAEVDG